MTTQVVVAFIFGFVFIVALLTLAIAFPKPTPFQYNVFRIVLSLASAGVAATIPGFINIELESTVGLIVRAGGALAVFVVVFFFNPARLAITKEIDDSSTNHGRIVQEQNIAGDSTNLQAGGDLRIGETKHEQRASAGEASIIVQAGRDALLQIVKAAPNIKLVRLAIEDDRAQGGLKQKVNVIIKNSGDTTAFLLNGYLVTDGFETITNCNFIGMNYQLSKSDWTYDVNIDDTTPSFLGQHAIAPNEIVNFNVVVGRKAGGFEPTVYRCYLRLKFDESEDLVAGPFHLMIAGPTEWAAGFQAQGPSTEEWGRCQLDNIQRLDRIGYDHRPNINMDSRKYVEAVAPGIFAVNGVDVQEKKMENEKVE